MKGEVVSLLQNRVASNASSSPIIYSHPDAGVATKEDSSAHACAEPWHSVCTSTAWLRSIELVDRYAHTSDPVSIVGECGTGKRFMVERICSMRRHAERLMRVACGKLASELSTGSRQSCVAWQAMLAEALHHRDSTWWLDGIDELPLAYQSVVFELLNEIRGNHEGGQLPVACTSKLPLFEMLETGRLLEDLYYALAVHEVELPPLRKRPGDILALTNHFSTAKSTGAPTIRFSQQATAALCDYDWPGNVTELRNVVARARVLADRTVIDSEHLLSIWKQRRRATADLTSLSLEDAETQLILKALERSGGNKTAAAKHLGITARTLHNKMQKYKSLGLIVDSD